MSDNATILDSNTSDGVRNLFPEEKIQFRECLDGGLSGASVFLVDFHLNNVQRLGVVKLAAAQTVAKEKHGYEMARGSWLAPFLPEYNDARGPIADNDRHVLLASLAKGRRDESEQLSRVLADTFSYGRDVLRALAFAYRQEAARLWSGEAPPVRKCAEIFQQLAQHAHVESWLDPWVAAGLPDKENPSISFEDRGERWPNPIAYLFQHSLWHDVKPSSISVPALTCHGDLNPQNVLCPTIYRQAAMRLRSDAPDPNELLKYVSLIDPPFCVVAPFTYDPAFLAAWLQRTLLPPFNSQTNVDIALSTYDAVLREIALGSADRSVHMQGQNYAECIRAIWGEVMRANSKKQEDLRDAFLISLVAANVWQAIKAFSKARPEAVSKICMAAMALKLLLGQERVAKPDFELWLQPANTQRRKWTSAASKIGAFLGGLSDANPLVVVLGSQWRIRTGMPSDEQAQAWAGLMPSELQTKLDEISSRPQHELSSLGRLPVTLVLDYSYFGEINEQFKRGMPIQRYLRDMHQEGTQPDWTDVNAVFHFSLRGTLRYPDTLAFNAPERSRNRRRFRPFLEAFERRRGAMATIIIVGATSPEISEIVAFLQEIWKESLHGVCVGELESDRRFLDEWGFKYTGGGIDDFVVACDEFAAARTDEVVRGIESQLSGPTVMVSGVQQTTDGIVIDKNAPQPTRVSIPLEDADAFVRAGRLLHWEDLATFDRRERDPRQFFVGHRVLMSEIHQRMPITRGAFNDYCRRTETLLRENYPQILAIPSRPGAGASTLALCIAYEMAFKRYVPTLILDHGGQHAFEAIERLHRLVKRSFLVVADPEDVGADELRMLSRRCAPSRYPAVFLTTIRTSLDNKTVAQQNVDKTEYGMPPTLSLELDYSTEREPFLRALALYCRNLQLASVASSPAQSFFLLSLDAFGGERIDVDRFVKQIMSQADSRARLLLATVSLFSRFAHRTSTVEFLEIVSGCASTEIEDSLEPYKQLLVLRQTDGWSCRHEELSKRILQYHLLGGFEGDEYRSRLADFICADLLDEIDDHVPGCELAAEYVWSLINPQLETTKSLADEKSVSRLLGSEDGLRYNADRYKLHLCAAQKFPRHVNIVSHLGKYLAETENKFDEADRYLQSAYELDPDNRAVLHMIGKRYKDEVQQIIGAIKAAVRTPRDNERIYELSKLAHDWFDQARRLDLGSEYNYTTPVELDILLIDDEFHKLGLAKHNQAGRGEKLGEPRISQLFAHADALIAEGLRYLEPREESRTVFNRVRSKVIRLRGDLDTAIALLERQVLRVAQGSRPTLSVQLARYLVERAEKEWLVNDLKSATKDFKKAERHLDFVLQDPGQTRNIKLWFDSARHLAHLSRNELLQRMHRYHDRDAHDLDGCFLLMCLYFCEAVETRSREAWRKCEQFINLSSQLSAPMGARRATREWLVEVNTGSGREYRFYPANLFPSMREDRATEIDDRTRLRLRGSISHCRSATAGRIRIDDCGIELFFQPRVVGREFYQHDEGVRVEFLVSFTYEKPQAFDVRRLKSNLSPSPD